MRRSPFRQARKPPIFLRRTPEQVAQAGYDGLMAGKRLVVPGIGNKIVTTLPRFVPRGMGLRIMESYQRAHGRRAENWKKRPKV